MPSNEAQVRKDLATVEQGLIDLFRMLTEERAKVAKLTTEVVSLKAQVAIMQGRAA